MIQDKINILITDCNMYYADMLARSINQRGYRAFRSYNCDQALIIIEHSRIDLVIIGDLLPEDDGSRMQGILNRINVPLVRLQSYPDGRAAEAEPRLHHPAIVLAKPVPTGTLMDTVSRLIYDKEAGARLPA